MERRYCTSLTEYQRRETWEVEVANVPMGGKNPIRIQTMTNTNTKDVIATVRQIIKTYQAGAEYVRVTVPTMQDADALSEIVAQLTKSGYAIPLVADIHFNPKIARACASIVDKVRVNPGNFVDSKRFEHIEYSDSDYQAELLKIKEEFVPLLTICKKHHTAIRIGTNHGSLSDRIMSRYGDTPMGMVESSMEFLRICRDEEFKNVVISMKASNTQIMVQATRLLVQTMEEEGMKYPIHLGVTEAGEGEDGRIKSAVGIGALLADGIGETVRVSLTEEPEYELPVASKLVEYIASRSDHNKIPEITIYPIDPFNYKRRLTTTILGIGSKSKPIVIGSLNQKNTQKGSLSPDLFFLKDIQEAKELDSEGGILEYGQGDDAIFKQGNILPLFKFGDSAWKKYPKNKHHFLRILSKELTEEAIQEVKYTPKAIVVLETDNANGLADQRAAFVRLLNSDVPNPVIIKRNYVESNLESFQIKTAADIGPLYIDGLGDGIWLENHGELAAKDLTATAFGILQACRVRVSKTEYISCPSCGRTLFNLQDTTQKIRQKTEHLKGLKIGIMGCIVNGPGEMADADYGYVGAGPGKITLYKEKDVIIKSIPEAEAVDKLIELIKENGDWVNP